MKKGMGFENKGAQMRAYKDANLSEGPRVYSALGVKSNSNMFNFQVVIVAFQ